MKNRILFAAVTLVAVAVWGCTKPASTPVAGSPGLSNTTQADDHAGHDHDHGDHADHDHGDHAGHDHGDHAGHDHGDAATETTLVSLMYCGDCGHSFAKGSEHTCDADHEKCEKCGLHKGSDLCCKIESGAFVGMTLCGACGEIAGSEACCKEGAEVCEKCSRHKGSPLCCLGAEADAPAEEAAAPAEAEAAPAAEEAPAAVENAAEEAAPAAEEKAAEEKAAEAAPAKEGEG